MLHVTGPPHAGHGMGFAFNEDLGAGGHLSGSCKFGGHGHLVFFDSGSAI